MNISRIINHLSSKFSRLSITACFVLAIGSVSGQEMKNLLFDGHASTGFIINQTDLESSNYPGERPNLFVSGGLSYYLKPLDAWISGDVMFGNVDGNNDTAFFNTILYNASAHIKFDMLKWFWNTPLTLSPKVGLGIIFYNSQLVSIETGRILQQSPNPETKTMSPNPNVLAGFEIAYPLTDKVSIQVGFDRRTMFGNDYFDSFLFDSPFESIDVYSAGLSFEFGRGKKKKTKRFANTNRADRDDIVEMTNAEYSALVMQIDSLQTELARAEDEQNNRYKEKNEELRTEIASLNRVIDSLQADSFRFDIGGFSDTTMLDLDEDAFSEAKYHLVLHNVKSKAEAQAYIDRSSLDRSKMNIIFVPIENRYSILYKSFDNFLLARKERDIVKRVEPHVWIARF